MSTPSEDADRDRRQRLFALLGGAALLAAILVVVLIVVSQDDDGAGGTEPAAALEDVPEDGIALGDPDAPVTIVEFADAQCPFCAEYTTDVLPELVDEYVATGEVRMELRLLNFIGDDSRRLANAANAAGEQDGMWRFMDLAFARQGAENSGYADLAFIEKLAVDAGLEAGADPDGGELPGGGRALGRGEGAGRRRGNQLNPELPDRADRRRARAAGRSTSLDADAFRGPIDDALAAADGGSGSAPASSPGY